MAAKRCRKPSQLGPDICKERERCLYAVAPWRLEHLALSLRVEARQPDGDEFDLGVVRALEYPDARVLYNNIHYLYTLSCGQRAYKDLEPRRHL